MTYYRSGTRNPDWRPNEGFPDDKVENTFPRRAFLNGAKNALVVVFFTNKTELYYSCRDFALQGIRVSMHISFKDDKIIWNSEPDIRYSDKKGTSSSLFHGKLEIETDYLRLISIRIFNNMFLQIYFQFKNFVLGYFLVQINSAAL